MAFAGHDSGAMLLGVFQVSVLHNIVHMLFGEAGIQDEGKRSIAQPSYWKTDDGGRPQYHRGLTDSGARR